MQYVRTEGGQPGSMTYLNVYLDTKGGGGGRVGEGWGERVGEGWGERVGEGWGGKGGGGVGGKSGGGVGGGVTKGMILKPFAQCLFKQ